MAQFDAIGEETGVAPRYDTAPERFGYLVRALHRQRGQPVAVLVDEYGKPILDALNAPETARANRDFLRGLYLFEFKVVDAMPEGKVMEQLKEKRYADKYRGSGQPIHLIAVEFSKSARNPVAPEVAGA